MTDIYNRFRLLVRLKLGRCPRCIQWSFRGAVLFWALKLLLPAQTPRFCTDTVVAISAAFTSLWLMHIVVAGCRRARASFRGAMQNQSSFIQRRRAALDFMRATIAVIGVSIVFPQLADPAQQRCESGFHLCADGRHCCRDGYNYACPENECTGETGKCRKVITEEDYSYLQRCCRGFFRC